MKDIAKFIRKQKMSLIIIYGLSFGLILVLIFSIAKNPAYLFGEWAINSIVMTDEYKGVQFFHSCFGNIGYHHRHSNTIYDALGSFDVRYVNNHYTQSVIILPSIFITCCWIMLSYITSFLKKIHF